MEQDDNDAPNRDDESHGSADDGDDESTRSCPDLTDETLERLKDNDPNLVGLTVRESNWICGAGRIIGGSMLLKKLKIYLTWDNPSLAELCLGLATNESIELFCLTVEKNPIFDPPHTRVFQVVNSDDFLILGSFFQNNRNLRGIEITKYPYTFDPTPDLRSLALALTKCTSDKLEKFQIGWNNTASDEEVAALFDSLNEKFTLLDVAVTDNLLERRGRTALANLVGKSSSKIHTLTLKNLCNRRHDDCIPILCNAIIKNNTLRSLDLTNVGDISMAGCMSISMVLLHPLSSLKSLKLDYTDLFDEGIICLGNALAVNKTLKHLELNNNESITLTGWQEFSNCLKSPQVVLEDLFLQECDIDDEKAEVIFSILADNTSLKILSIYNNELCTIRGLVAFFHSLLGSNSVIEEMAFFDEIDVTDITEDEWSILSRALCDKTTIETTYLSNHTFYICYLFDNSWCDCEEGTVWEEIYTSMEMNSNRNKVEVARAKILFHHFWGRSTGIHELACMHETLLPHVIEWMGRDELGYSALFKFVQSFPTLFDVSHVKPSGSKRRKV